MVPGKQAGRSLLEKAVMRRGWRVVRSGRVRGRQRDRATSGVARVRAIVPAGGCAGSVAVASDRPTSPLGAPEITRNHKRPSSVSRLQNGAVVQRQQAVGVSRFCLLGERAPASTGAPSRRVVSSTSGVYAPVFKTYGGRRITTKA